MGGWIGSIGGRGGRIGSIGGRIGSMGVRMGSIGVGMDHAPLTKIMACSYVADDPGRSAKEKVRLTISQRLHNLQWVEQINHPARSDRELISPVTPQLQLSSDGEEA